MGGERGASTRAPNSNFEAVASILVSGSAKESDVWLLEQE